MRFVLAKSAQHMSLDGLSIDLTRPVARYNLALLLFAVCLLGCLVLVRSGDGRVLIAVRENESAPRCWLATPSTTSSWRWSCRVMAGAAGAVYGCSFPMSARLRLDPILIFPYLGALGDRAHPPLVGTALMFYVVDVSSEYSSSYMLVVASLILLVLVPEGILGTLRQWVPWLPRRSDHGKPETAFRRRTGGRCR
jgi:branched-chain amino acid transport system permease protein